MQIPVHVRWRMLALALIVCGPFSAAPSPLSISMLHEGRSSREKKRLRKSASPIVLTRTRQRWTRELRVLTSLTVQRRLILGPVIPNLLSNISAWRLTWDITATSVATLSFLVAVFDVISFLFLRFAPPQG